MREVTLSVRHPRDTKDAAIALLRKLQKWPTVEVDPEMLTAEHGEFMRRCCQSLEDYFSPGSTAHEHPEKSCVIDLHISSDHVASEYSLDTLRSEIHIACQHVVEVVIHPEDDEFDFD